MKGCRPLTDTEVTLVAMSFGGMYAARDKALFLLGVTTGFRISELLSLTVGDVYQHGRVVERVTVRRAHMKRKTEGRTVVVHPKAQAALQVWLTEFAAAGALLPSRYVFASRKGVNRPICRETANQILHDAYATNGLNGQLGTHSMRKTFANNVYDKLGRDLVKTQRAMGHKNINSTVSYLSFCEAEIDQAILALRGDT
jgi:site-specific recombinase XerD